MKNPCRFLFALCLVGSGSLTHASPGAAPEGSATTPDTGEQTQTRPDFEAPKIPDALQTPEVFNFAGTYVSPWPTAAAGQIAPNASNTFPYLIPGTAPFEQDIYVWDAWPVRDATGAVADIAGWTMLVGLSSEVDTNSPYPFYTRSTWRYWFTRNGDWTPGGVLFDRAEALGSRQWAGSVQFDPDANQMTFFYTAVGALDAESLEADMPPRALGSSHPGAGRPNTEQRMAMVSASVAADDNGVSLSDFGPHEMILEADGDIYVTEAAYVPGAVIYGMRDPHYWYNAENDREYILFTANAAGLDDPFNGVVGLAEKIDGSWTLKRPIIAAPGVSAQLERPHVVKRDDGIYVFFSTHAFTFADGLSGPEGLYGFYNKDGDIAGHYVPMNGSGLVLGNPPASATQTYSYLVLPDGAVMSYINTPYGHSKDPDSEREFVGAPGPLVRIGFKDGRSRLEAAPDTTMSVD